LSDPTIDEVLTEVEERFRVPVITLIRQEIPSHNVHYIASTSKGTFHVTVRIPRRLVETAEELEFIARIEANIPAETALLVKTNVLSRFNRYLEPLDDTRFLAVRQHWGEVCSKSHDLAAIVNVAVKHGAGLDRMASRDLRCRTTVLRYAAPSEAIPAIRRRIYEFVSAHATAEEIRRLTTHLERTASVLERSHAYPRFVHGDLSYQNLVLEDSDLQVIDHDCLHFDYPLYDLAHVMLSVSCSRYFSGILQKNVVRYFLGISNERIGVDPSELSEVASYVMLKKTALVRTPANLRIAERLAILDDLRNIA
jgi:Ser/Thr protein kinase RdoA (MazF antagonist)